MTVNLMGQSLSDLRRWRSQEPLDHRKLNEPVDAINQMNRGVGVPRQVLTPGVAKPLPGGALQTVLLVEPAGDTDDHLMCRALTDIAEVFTPILVAKPWFLRKTPWDGQTREQVRYEYDVEDSTRRTAFDIAFAPGSPDSERSKRLELISPLYLLHDQILVAPAVTGVTVEDVPVTWIDITGRDWTVFFEQL